MNTVSNHAFSGEENSISDSDELLGALDALQPCEQQQKYALFAKAYPGILRAIARKVPQKDILATLSHGGLKLHPIRYREMLEAERKLHDESGKRICCATCGSTLCPEASSGSATLENSSQNIKMSDGIMASQSLHSMKKEAA